MRRVADNVVAWTEEPLTTDVARALERLGRLADVRYVAAMPDVHLSEHVCVGVVLATRELLYPVAIGQDIGCGVRAVRLALGRRELDEKGLVRLLSLWARAIPVQRQKRRPELTAELAPERLSVGGLRRIAEHDAGVTLGTLGRGNHFVELDVDDDGELWLIVHSGSRGLGPAIAAHYRGDRPLASLVADSEPGRAFQNDVACTVDWARENRRRIADVALDCLRQLLRVEVLAVESIDGAHDFLRQELHFGEPHWVHRKGANSASDGELAVIPGSMGAGCRLVSGRGHAAALCSSSHGAGRALSRSEARSRIGTAKLAREMGDVVYDERLAPQLCDEAPSAYKRLDRVMRAQLELTRTLQRLQPLCVYKGV